ncbi:MAG: MFS transporter [Chloroflexota bacterium]
MSVTGKKKGIFYGWWIVVASFLLYMTVGGVSLYGFTAFFNPIIAEMGWTRAQTAFAFSLRSIEGGVTQPFIGFFIDRFGAKKVIFFGIVITAVSFVLMSRISSLPTFYFSFLLLALGHGTGAGIAQYSVIAKWFRRRRALALGIISSGYGPSGLIAPLLVYMIHTYGWRNSLFFIGPAVLAIGIPLAFMIRNKPETYGLLPDGDKIENQVEEPAGTGATNHESHSQRSSSGVPEAGGMNLKEAVRTRSFRLLVSFSIFSFFAQAAMTTFVMPVLISVGISENMAALTVTGITLSSVVGRLGFSWLGDIYDKRKLLIISTIMKSLGVFIFINIRAPWMIIPFLVLYGPAFGGTMPLLPAIQADCFGTRSFATLTGLMYLGGVIPGLIAPLFAGWVFDTQGSYHLAFTVFAIIGFIAVPMMMMIRLPVKEART